MIVFCVFCPHENVNNETQTALTQFYAVLRRYATTLERGELTRDRFLARTFTSPRPGDANVLTGFPLLSLNFKENFVKIANWHVPALV